jgi:hypothetical protein
LARSAKDGLPVLPGDEPVFFGRRAKSVRVTLQRLAAKGSDALEVRKTELFHLDHEYSLIGATSVQPKISSEAAF